MLIGISGKAGSGKTTAAEYLIKNYNFVEYSFSIPIKNMLCTMLDCDLMTLEKYKESNEILIETGTTLRKLLQTLGTDWGRNIINSNIWIYPAKKFIIENKNKNIVISDVRFLNEIESIYNLDGRMIYIQRDNINRLINEDFNHESENGLDILFNNNNSSDKYIENNYDIKYLYNEINSMFEN